MEVECPGGTEKGESENSETEDLEICKKSVEISSLPIKDKD